LKKDGTPDLFNCEPFITQTRSEAWRLPSKHAVVLIERVAGCVHLDHLVIRVEGLK
jgi:hypothetical protein